MTLLVSWAGIDSHGTASVYIASDSRISWGSNECFDYGRKVFAFNHYPDILGYCGDVLFPSMVLGQIVEMGDCGLLFGDGFSCDEKSRAVENKLVQLFNKYPTMVKTITSDVLQVIHASREPRGISQFFCRLMQWRRGRGWSSMRIELPPESGVLQVLGSGRSEFNANYKRYSVGPSKATSRSVFHCFCDALFNTREISVGGAPQLVGVYRKPGSSAVRFGIIRDEKRYLFGAEVDDLASFGSIEWRNDKFELCDGRTMQRLGNAQPQPDPLRRLKTGQLPGLPSS